MIAMLAIRNNFVKYLRRFYSESASQGGGSKSSTNSTSLPPLQVKSTTDVPGLSSAVIKSAAQPVGPGVDPNKSGAYKVPEYFCYNNMSFFEAEIEMSKYRLPQPSALKK